ncbi:MAG: 4'-phosphopantetheinyl transferase superfamily protein [Draconibacterium sp.]|nr:4'-phosphopantetheinyl transferase superfamily protein [Draconibacterium sp.]
MPFVKKINNDIGTLGIWKLSETASNLVSKFNFSTKEKGEFTKIKVDRRKTEYLATRLLLQNLLKEKAEIKYLGSGKPILKEIQKNISISHSSDFVVVLLSNNQIGIDVENTNRNIKKIANRFLSEAELKHTQKLENWQPATVLYWSAKEAIFKCTEQQGIQFNKQIFIPSFEIINQGLFTATLTCNNTITNYKLWYYFYENNVIVYCVE